MNSSTANLLPGKIAEVSINRTPLIWAKNLGVLYQNDNRKRDEYKSLIYRSLFSKKNGSNDFWALKGINFKAYSGEMLGVIGSNGAGKTTLCRVLSGLLLPDAGSIDINGRITSLLSLGLGFNKELTGRENIFLNGMMLGLTIGEIKKKLSDIEQFSGLNNHLKKLIKNYSSGMKARLGFSIVSAIEADILVIDEVLSAGDMEFQERSRKKILELVKHAKLVIVVSHKIDFVEENCSRVLWIDQGILRASGNPEKVIKDYKEAVSEKMLAKKNKLVNLQKTNNRNSGEKLIEASDLGISFNERKNKFWALKGLSFDIKEQEIIGLIGSNGSGKTTLCRTLSGIYKADEGKLKVNGKVSALFSFGGGFNIQLSGRDNIYLKGMLLGIPKKTIRSIENEVVEFSELDRFIDSPIKYYSDGMKARLGFSVAAMLRPDIFIVDEALNAGDISFNEKASAKMQNMLEEAKVVVIVTHSMNIVKKLCTRVIWLQDGLIKYNGKPEEAVSKYKEFMKIKSATYI